MIDSGHVDQMASRQGDVGGDAGALGADRLLGDLHQQLLPLLQQLLDRMQRLEIGMARRRCTVAVVLLVILFAVIQQDSYSSMASNTSATYRKAAFSRPISTKAACMPGSTRMTRPL